MGPTKVSFFCNILTSEESDCTRFQTRRPPSPPNKQHPAEATEDSGHKQRQSCGEQTRSGALQ